MLTGMIVQQNCVSQFQRLFVQHFIPEFDSQYFFFNFRDIFILKSCHILLISWSRVRRNVWRSCTVHSLLSCIKMRLGPNSETTYNITLLWVRILSFNVFPKCKMFSSPFPVSPTDYSIFVHIAL